MAIGLLNQGITPVAGQAAFLPNQPILQGCIVESTAVNPLVPGAIVAMTQDAEPATAIVVGQAEVTDVPLGVVVYQSIKTGFRAGDRVSVFPTGSFVYLPAGDATIKRGNKVQFTAENKVVPTATALNGYIGIAVTEPGVQDDLIVVQIQPSLQMAG